MKETKYIGRALCLIAAVIMFVSAFPASAPAEILYEEKESQTVTAGVALERITRMYGSGWVDVYALRVDLTNPNVKLDVLESATELGLRETVEQMANSSGSLAAVNGDFFGGTAVSTSMGIIVKEGSLQQARNYYNASSPTYAGIYIDGENRPYIDYLKITNLSFLTNGVSKMAIEGKNKVTDMKRPIYIDRTAMADTSKLDARFKGLYKLVVDNGRIVDISAAGATKTVPEKGFLIVMDAKTAVEQLNNFAVGDTVAYTEYSQLLGNPSLPLGAVKFGISGGGKILENGQYKDTGLIVEPGKRHPRTAIGINQQKTELIIAAIDGRSGTSMGATHYETYEIMRSLGCWDAFHLDGGGSTTLLAREEGKQSITLQNSPSGGEQRKVANAIGVSSASEPGEVVGMYLWANGSKDSATALATQPVRLSVAGYDENYNPVTLTDVSFSQEGVGGSLSGSSFTPSSEGETVITAEYGDITATVTVNALSAPTGVRITPLAFSAEIGETVNLRAELVNSEGYGVDITELSPVWSVIGNVGAFEGAGKFKASANGTGYVSVSYGGFTGSAAVAVGSQVRNLLDFESVIPVSYMAEGSTAKGSVAYSTATKHQGNYSLNITYSFQEKLASKQTASVDFTNSQVFITEKPLAFAFQMTGDGAGSTVNAVFTDGAGAEQVYSFTPKMDNGDWKYYYSKFPANVTLPLKLTRITITSAEKLAAPVNGSVFMDTLHVAYPNKPDGTLFRDSMYNDPMRGQLLTSENVTEIAVFGPTAPIKTEEERSLFEYVAAKIQQDSRLAVFAGYTAELPPMVTETVKWLDLYSVKDIPDARIITLGTSRGGLRATSPSQWTNLVNDLNNSGSKNVILIMNKDIWSRDNGFTDTKERDLFHKVLKEHREKTGANILVASGTGAEIRSYIVDGVRYISLNGLFSDGRGSGYGILRVWTSGGIMSYDLDTIE